MAVAVEEVLRKLRPLASRMDILSYSEGMKSRNSWVSAAMRHGLSTNHLHRQPFVLQPFVGIRASAFIPCVMRNADSNLVSRADATSSLLRPPEDSLVVRKPHAH